jgi:hypothetical protein
MGTLFKSRIKGVINRVVENHYSLSLTWRSYLIERLIKDQIFIVYSDGKVGSTTLTASLKKNYPNQFIFHIHRLTAESVLQMEKDYSDFHPKNIPDNFIQSKFLLKNLNELYDKNKIYFFSLVRDPVAALISEYCENFPYEKKRLIQSDDDIVGEIVQKICIVFKSDRIKSRLEWFDRELNRSLDFDIYMNSFDRDKGYHVYSDRDLLILKLEAFNQVAPYAIKEFLGFSDFTICEGNKAESKSYSQIYNKVKQAIRLPGEIIDEIYSSKYIRYFYGDKEIYRFKNRWQ